MAHTAQDIPKVVQQHPVTIVLFRGTPGTPYRPSNGTCGEFFMQNWCEACDRDKVMNGEATQAQADKDPDLYCSILTAASMGEAPEWTHRDDGQPCCTSFVPAGEPVPHRCEKTADIFDGDAERN